MHTVKTIDSAHHSFESVSRVKYSLYLTKCYHVYILHIPSWNIRIFSFEIPEEIKPHANRKSKKQFWFDQECHTIKGQRQGCLTLSGALQDNLRTWYLL
jgi:hypothetical protein